MDATTARLVDFTLAADYSALPASTVHECKRRLVDTLACAMGGFDEAVSRMARAMALRSPAGTEVARIWGCGATATPEAAAFANGVMLRALDMNDTYGVKSIGHPSDVIAGILAIGEAVRADGASVIAAITLAYDVYCSFCETIDINAKGWDQPVYGELASVLGAGKLLRLSRAQLGNAVALALAPNMALYQTRHGELSAWKGCAGANASRNAVFAATLALEGFTGPTAVFEGVAGLWDIVGRFDWTPSAGGDIPHRVTRTDIKLLPICYHGQAAAWAALDVRPRLAIETITEVRIETYRPAVEAMANDPSRWAPKTRETADHSLPYVVALALLDGEITAGSFAPQRLTDPAVAALMRKVKVVASAELTERYPESPSVRMWIESASNATVFGEIRYPKGHVNNPASDSDLEEKFRTHFGAGRSNEQCENALRGLWSLETAPDVSEVIQRFCG